MSDAATASIMTGIVTITGLVVGFLTIYVRLKYGEKRSEDRASALEKKTDDVSKKVDNNTVITKAVSVVAAKNAKVAAEAAIIAAETTKEINEHTREISGKLNGGVDSAIRTIINPVQKALEEHAAQDDKALMEAHTKIDELTRYVHEREHELRNSLQGQASKLEVILQILKGNK